MSASRLGAFALASCLMLLSFTNSSAADGSLVRVVDCAPGGTALGADDLSPRSSGAFYTIGGTKDLTIAQTGITKIGSTVVNNSTVLRHFYVYVPAVNKLRTASGVPRAVDPSTGRPINRSVVLYLHGGGLGYDTVSNRNSLLGWKYPPKEWLDIADEEGLIIVYPNGTRLTTNAFGVKKIATDGNSQHWNDCRNSTLDAEYTINDVAFLDSLIQWLKDRGGNETTSDAQGTKPFYLAANRVYVTGASNGGMMGFTMIGNTTKSLSGVAGYLALVPAVNCGTDPGSYNSVCQIAPACGLSLTNLTKPRVPVMIGHGDDDVIAPWIGGPMPPSSDGGEVLSARRTLDFWYRYNNFKSSAEDLAAITTFTDTHFGDADGGGDGSLVCRRDYAPTVAGGKAVRFQRATHSGHLEPSVDWQVRAGEGTWGFQNHDVESAREAWAFFKSLQ